MTLLGVGHALVDAFAFTGDDAPKALGLHTGRYNIVPDYRMKAILLTLASRNRMAGGSAANVVKLASRLGLPGFFVSQCGTDDAGSLFESELLEAGVRTNLHRTDAPTGTCVTFLSSSGSATVATFRSAATGLPANLVSDAVMREADVTILEGYLLDEPGLVEAVLSKARRLQKKTAFDTSEVGVVERNRERLWALLRTRQIDYLFAQESEAAALAGAASESALTEVGRLVETFVVKRGPQGCLLVNGGSPVVIDAIPQIPVDTTGAGDAFQAGFFWGLDRKLPAAVACDCGTLVAQAVLSQPGTKLDPDTLTRLRFTLESRFPLL